MKWNQSIRMESNHLFIQFLARGTNDQLCRWWDKLLLLWLSSNKSGCNIPPPFLRWLWVCYCVCVCVCVRVCVCVCACVCVYRHTQMSARHHILPTTPLNAWLPYTPIIIWFCRHERIPPIKKRTSALAMGSPSVPGTTVCRVGIWVPSCCFSSSTCRFCVYMCVSMCMCVRIREYIYVCECLISYLPLLQQSRVNRWQCQYFLKWVCF